MRVELRNVSKYFGDLTAVDDVSLTIDDGEFVTLVGPSGCGKTTTLRCIAGLERVSEGEIHFGDRDVTDTRAQDRNVAMVFQDYALYPHMTARRNMSFALEDEGVPKTEISRKVEETAAMLGIDEHLDKRPEELSGGQQQRVALGRSIVRDPEVFLLDEPLANLDAKLRVQMRAELQKLHQELGTTTIYVTHDQEEAMTMSDRIAILDEGRLQQVSPPETAYNRPKNRFAASFIGSPAMNFLSATTESGRLTAAGFELDIPDDVDRQVAEVGVRPEDFRLHADGRGAVEGQVSVFEQIGSFNIVYFTVPDHEGELVAQVPASKHFDAADTVGVSIADGRVHLFTASGEAVYNPPLHAETDTAIGTGPTAETD